MKYKFLILVSSILIANMGALPAAQASGRLYSVSCDVADGYLDTWDRADTSHSPAHPVYGNDYFADGTRASYATYMEEFDRGGDWIAYTYTRLPGRESCSAHIYISETFVVSDPNAPKRVVKGSMQLQPVMQPMPVLNHTIPQ